MPRPEKEITPFYKVKGILSTEDAQELRQESIATLEELKKQSQKKKLVRVNEYTWIEVRDTVSDEEAIEHFLRKIKKLKEIH